MVFLNAKWRRVVKNLHRSLSGLSRRIELGLLDFLTFQLDRELISHNVMVSELEERVHKMFSKSAGMLEAMEELKRNKTAQEVRLLGGLKN